MLLFFFFLILSTPRRHLPQHFSYDVTSCVTAAVPELWQYCIILKITFGTIAQLFFVTFSEVTFFQTPSCDETAAAAPSPPHPPAPTLSDLVTYSIQTPLT